MTKSLVLLIFIYGCAENSKQPHSNTSLPDSNKSAAVKSSIQYDRLKEYLLSSDSVVLFSHVSPNEPTINRKTGKYYSHSVPFIEKGEINYAMSVQERKKLNRREIQELANILSLTAVDDSIRMLCFQPRNAVVAFKKGRFSYFDFCFDCHGVSQFGDFGSDLIMNGEKYKKLFIFYKKHGFKYEMD